jgi:hypothetical protein
MRIGLRGHVSSSWTAATQWGARANRNGGPDRWAIIGPVRSPVVPEPFVELPDHVTLTRDEVAAALLGLDTSMMRVSARTRPPR